MKAIKRVTVPAHEEERTEYLACDLCGIRTTDGRCWPEAARAGEVGPYIVRDVTVSLREGTSYPEGGNTETTIVDLCPRCFRDRLLPWLESQGAKPRGEETDW